MNYHLILDEKFLDIFVEDRIEYFKNGNNTFVIRDKRKNNNYKYITHPFIMNNLISLDEFDKLLLSNKKYCQAKIFIHFLHENFYESILTLPRTAMVYWIYWGGDFYSPLSKYADRILDPKTIKLYYENTRLAKLLPFPFQIKKKIITFVHTKKHNLKLKQKVIQRVDYFLHWNIMDFQLVKNECKSQMEYLYFQYISSENAYLKSLLNNDVLSQKKDVGVLFGNSAHFTNNHLDGLDILYQKFKPREVKIYCPLSYGPEYVANVVSKYGCIRFGESFIPLLIFMPLETYWSFLNQNVNILFMNQRRTQAGDNIIRCIYLGKKVYMRKENTLFQLLINNGVKVFSIEDDFTNDNKENILAPLSEIDQEVNRNNLMDIFSDEKVRQTNSLFF